MSKIIGIFGLQGSGKTMLMTFLGKTDHEKGRTIYSNYHLNNIPYIPITSFDDIDNIKKGSFLADELWLWVFSRSSMSKINQELTKIVMLNRKRDVDIYYTAQLSREVDVLLRSVTNYWVYPVIKPFNIRNDGIEKTVFRLCYTVFDLKGHHSAETILNSPLEYLGSFYNTHEEIGTLKKNNENAPLTKGIQLENIFAKALNKVKGFNRVVINPSSGIYSDLKYDVIGYTKGKTFCFDVKGTNKERVYFEGIGLKDKITNAHSFNMIPYIAFPRNDVEHTSSLKAWYIYHLTYTSYLNELSPKTYPFYNKLIKDSILLKDFILNYKDKL